MKSVIPHHNRAAHSEIIGFVVFFSKGSQFGIRRRSRRKVKTLLTDFRLRLNRMCFSPSSGSVVTYGFEACIKQIIPLYDPICHHGVVLT
jgi:hypothetical protein